MTSVRVSDEMDALLYAPHTDIILIQITSGSLAGCQVITVKVKTRKKAYFFCDDDVCGVVVVE